MNEEFIREQYPEMDFTLSATIQVDGEAWHVGGTRMDKGWGNGATIDRVMAIKEGADDYVFFIADSVSPSGEVSGYAIERVTEDESEKKRYFSGDERDTICPKEVQEKMKAVAEEGLYHNGASMGYDGDQFYPTINGQRWVVGTIQTAGGSFEPDWSQAVAQSLPGREELNGEQERKPTRCLQLRVNRVDERGNIADFTAYSLKDGEKKWQEVDVEQSEDKEVIGELKRYVEYHKCYGELRDGVLNMFDSHVEAVAKNLDAEAAKLFLEEHENALAEALDDRDFDQAAISAKQVASYREALDKLQKPENHVERLRFEREQQEAVDRNGDGERFTR